MSEHDKVNISIIIPVFNEEQNIGACLNSIKWADETFVIDAYSNDETVCLAKEYNVKIYQHKWEGYSDQKNWALDELPISNEWVLFLDADERVSPELSEEIREVIEKLDQNEGYYISRRMIFLGRWLKHAWWYPDYNLRMFKRKFGRFENRAVHETVILNGDVGYLKNDLIHDDQRNLETYIGRLNRYSTLEASEMYRVLKENKSTGFSASWFGTWGERRRAIKERVWYRLPFKPIIRFIWIIVFRLGFLDGKEGFIFTILACFNDWMSDIKFFELMLIKNKSRAMQRISSPILQPDRPADENFDENNCYSQKNT